MAIQKKYKRKPTHCSFRRRPWRKRGAKQFNQGSGFVYTDATGPSALSSLYRHWNSILEATGHADIERFDYASGFFAPTFIKAKGSKTPEGSSFRQMRYYSPQKVQYYRLLGLFRHHADLRFYFGKWYKTRKFILEQYQEGQTLAEVALQCATTKAPRAIRRKRSYAWTYNHLKEIDKCVEHWVSTQPSVLNEE